MTSKAFTEIKFLPEGDGIIGRKLNFYNGDLRSITLEAKFDSEVPKKITQVPYHADMLPNYEYFAENIRETWLTGYKKDRILEEFVITNHFLPPSWLGDKVIPVLESIEARVLDNERALNGITTLKLSNCSLSDYDITSLAKFLAGNDTVTSFDISKSKIESVDTVNALAAAIKGHPALVHVNIGGGNHDALNKILMACKECDCLEIGNDDFDSESVSIVAKFIGKKSKLTSVILVGSPFDKSNRKSLFQSLVKNKNIQELGLNSVGIKIPSLFNGTKKLTESLSKLTHLDLSCNSLPLPGAKAMVKFFEKVESQLISLNLSNNKMKTAAADLLLPAIKNHTSLEHLDLSQNWLNDSIAESVVNLLANNTDLLTLNLSGNNNLKLQSGGRRVWRTGQRVPIVPRAGAQILKAALFDTTSLKSISNSNHACEVIITAPNRRSLQNETVRKINALDVSEGRKVRLKVVLALNETNTDLFDTNAFQDIPLELMPRVLELVQQDVRPHDAQLVQKQPKKQSRSYGGYREEPTADPDSALNRIYGIVSTWNSPLLFTRGSGVLKATKKKAKGQVYRRKRRKFGDDDDYEDETYIPKPARKRRVWNSETETWDYFSATDVSSGGLGIQLRARDGRPHSEE
eukprot:scaffold161261_cov64-Cyclotella_meneghiniana.AAC.1